MVFKPTLVDRGTVARASQHTDDLSPSIVIEFTLLTASPSFCDLIQYSEVGDLPNKMKKVTRPCLFIGRSARPKVCKDLPCPCTSSRPRKACPAILAASSIPIGSSYPDIQGSTLLVYEGRTLPTRQCNDAVFLFHRRDDKLHCAWIRKVCCLGRLGAPLSCPRTLFASNRIK